MYEVKRNCPAFYVLVELSEGNSTRPFLKCDFFNIRHAVVAITHSQTAGHRICRDDFEIFVDLVDSKSISSNKCKKMIISTILKGKVVTLHLHETNKGGRVCRTTLTFRR